MTKNISNAEIFDQIFDRFKKEAALIECKAENFMDFIVRAMEIVENYSKELAENVRLHGIEKKEMVRSLIERFFNDLVEWAEEQMEEWKKMQVEIAVFTDKVIDVLVAAAKGHLHLSEFKDNCNSLCCGGGAKRRVKSKAVIASKDVNTVNDLINQVYKDVKGAIANKKFTASNFVVLVTIVMQVVEGLSELVGEEKKQIVITVVSKIVGEIDMSEEDKVAVKIIVETTLSKTIDYIIMAANGELDIASMVEKVKKIFCC